MRFEIHPFAFLFLFFRCFADIYLSFVCFFSLQQKKNNVKRGFFTVIKCLSRDFNAICRLFEWFVREVFPFLCVFFCHEMIFQLSVLKSSLTHGNHSLTYGRKILNTTLTFRVKMENKYSFQFRKITLWSSKKL